MTPGSVRGHACQCLPIKTMWCDQSGTWSRIQIGSVGGAEQDQMGEVGGITLLGEVDEVGEVKHMGQIQ